MWIALVANSKSDFNLRHVSHTCIGFNSISTKMKLYSKTSEVSKIKLQEYDVRFAVA